MNTVARTWLQQEQQRLQRSPRLMFAQEVDVPKEFWSRVLDDGAVRTLHMYLRDAHGECFAQVCYLFYIWFYNEQQQVWKCRNASACVVSVCRYYWPELE